MQCVLSNRYVRMGAWLLLISFVVMSLGVPATALDGGPRILYVGEVDTDIHRALQFFGYDVEVIAASGAALGDINFMPYSLVIFGRGARTMLYPEQIQTRLLQAIEYGTVMIGFRSYSGGLSPQQDLWLPSPATMDGAYVVDTILKPDHPVFTTPHEITPSILSRIHGGVMYHPYVNLGEGWIPLVSGTELAPFFGKELGTPTFHGEPHYGIIELPYGEGRIILVQMIPDYQWFVNDRGRENSVGRLLLENILAYGIDMSRTVVTGDPEIPPEYTTGGLGALLEWIKPPSVAQMTLEQWETTTEGPFTVRWDDRDVLTIRHPHVPAVQGNHATITRDFPLESKVHGKTLLALYYTDDYHGGDDRIFEGHREVARFANYKDEHRFIEVRINGEKIHEEDLLGENAFPWQNRLRTLDITDRIQGDDTVRVSISVVDRLGTEDPFWTDVFVSRVSLIEGIPGRQGPGSVTAPESGEYMPVVRVFDAPGERGTLIVRPGADDAIKVTLSADDLDHHWVAGALVNLEQGEQIAVDFDSDPHGRGAEKVQEVYLLPKELLAHWEPEFADVRSWFGADILENRIGLTVKGPDGVDHASPISQGVPFAQGHVFSDKLDELRLFNADGHEIPMQNRSLALWPDGSVKWALISFVATPGDYELLLGPEALCHCRPYVQPAGVRLDVNDNLIESVGQNRYQVDTGKLSLTLDLTGAPRFLDATANGVPVNTIDLDFRVKHADGRQLSLTSSQIKEVKILENGSERSVLWLRGDYLSAGRPDLEFTMQWRFYRDQPFVWMDAAFTNRTGAKVQLRDIRLSMEGDFGTLLGVPEAEGGNVEKTSLSQGSQWSLVQSDDRSFVETLDGVNVGQGRRFPGWLVLEANPEDEVFFTGARYFWQQHPKSLRVTDTRLEFGLWAEEADTLLDVADGFQKTHEIVFGWIEPHQALGASKILEQPYVITVDPAYLQRTGALGIFATPTRSDGYPAFKAAYDESVQSAYTSYMNKREARRQYGMQNFGDDTFEWGFGPVYTFWSNQEYDHHYGFLLEYLRSGDLRFWQIGDQAARHYRDVDVIHHSVHSHLMGAPRSHNTTPVVEHGWYPDHNLGGVSVHHAWVEGLWLHYLLTGDELTYQAALGASDWFVSEVKADRWMRGRVERGAAWTLIALTGAYRATADKKYLEAAEEVADYIYLRQDPIRGVYSVPVDGQPSYEGGSPFMTSVLARGLARLYLESGDSRAAIASARLYNWLLREARVDGSRFIYKQAPNWRSPVTNEQIVSMLVYGLAFNNRQSDWPMVMDYVSLQEANVRNMPFMPEVMAILEYLYGVYVPMEILLVDSSRVEVGREGSSRANLSIKRLTASEEVDGIVEITGLPDGVKFSSTTIPYRLESGDTEYPFDVSIEVEPTVAPGRYPITVMDERRSDLLFAFPVEILGRRFVDRFQPPVVNPLFAGLSVQAYEEISDGWEYVRVSGADRLRRREPSEEYLIYDAPGFYGFALTVYASDSARADILEQIDISIRREGSHQWETIPVRVTWDDDAAGGAGFTKGVIGPEESFFRGDVKLKITLLPGGEPETIQFDQLEITGWR